MGRFSLAAADEDFIRSAPVRITHRIESEATCESLWQTLKSDGALTSWARGITGADWTSARPFGIGTTRTVRAGAFAALNERFFRWDEGHRMTFYVESASLPGFKRFAEDLVLEPTSTGSRLTWTVDVLPERLRDVRKDLPCLEHRRYQIALNSSGDNNT